MLYMVNKIKFIKLELKNLIKSMFISLVLINVILFMLLLNLNDFFATLKNMRDLSQLYVLVLLISISYSIIFISTINLEKEKLYNLYHRYFVIPIKSPYNLIIKIIPLVIIDLVLLIFWGVILFLMYSPVKLQIYLLYLLLSIIFIIGGILTFFYFNLTISNSSILHAIKFILIFAFAYIPKFLITKNISIQLLFGLILFLIIAIFFVGIFLVNKLSSEKVLLQ
ncbi:MAG: hypothetical protein JG776_1131 [Caloramator sp.]|nr:hypothetical protein [Caloramator sp.]